MKLEDQVCSLELSKRLKELGVKQESYFVWFKLQDKDNWDISEKWQIDDTERFDEISAFTVAELGERLPFMINGSFIEMIKGNNIWKENPMYCVRYFNAGLIGEPDISMANSYAKMMVNLIENGFIKI